MKRLIAILLCLSLSVGTAAALAAEKVNVNFYPQDSTATTATPKYVTNAVNIGDTVYVQTNQTLERWTPGDAQPTVLVSDVENPVSMEASDVASAEANGEAAYSKMFTDGDTVYGLDEVTGVVWKIIDATGPLAKPEVAAKLDWSGMNRHSDAQDYDYTPQISDVALIDGVLYLSVIDWGGDAQTYELIRWTFSTGALIEDKKNMPLRTLSAYSDGLILGKYYDEVNSWDEKTQTQKMPSLVTYNPATGEVKTLFDFDSASVYGVLYSAESDTLYYVDGSVVYSMPGLQKPAKVSAYLPNKVWDDASSLILPSGMIAIADYNGLIVRGLDMPGIEKGALTIYGEYGSSGHQAFVTANPQALINCSEDYYNSLEQFTNAMVSGNGAMDILELDSDYSPLRRLIEKGYALDLSAYPDIQAVAANMDPKFLDICTLDGKLYGLPITMSANAFGYNATVLEQLGLTEADLPTTFMDFLDFVENWQDDYGEDHTDVMLLDSGSVKESLVGWLMTDYTAYLTQQGQDLSFDTELFRKLMARIDSIDFTDLEMPADGNEEEFYSRMALFTTYFNVAYPSQYRYDTKLMPMQLDEGIDPVYPATLQVMIINPRTTRLDQAIQYMTVYAQNLEPTSAKITLFPNNNEPVINNSFESDLKSWKDSLDGAKQDVESAAPEDKASAEAMVEYYQNLIDTSEADRYSISAEDIATFRDKVAPYLVVAGQTPLNTWGDDGTNQFYTLETQYMQGAITMDQFIKEIDKRLRMMQMEDQ
ncbi:MAG TPA: hypothetical protein PLP25_04805 [Candidatus Limiplasma sp.]|nr:hypothetical protein [Candidatus Limiplasma sp.]HPS81162.1 hypothetical protein [Candidatus Limiplasma sp.]